MISVKHIVRPGMPRLAVTMSGERPQDHFVHCCKETAAMLLSLLQALGDFCVGSAAVDLRGHGRSDGHESLQEAGIEDYASDAKRAIEFMPPLRIVIGQSMGGLVTQLLAARREIAHAVLIACSPACGMKADGMRMARRHPWTSLMSSLQRSFKRLYLKEEVTGSLLFHSQKTNRDRGAIHGRSARGLVARWERKEPALA